jgi:O-acetyl-ADP-ribose deacetylase (regulator of RNase III)
MLTYRRTSLFESTCQTLVNTVNCVGVMGKGIAKEFKKRDPEMFKAYKRICDDKLLTPGKLWLWRGDENWVLNFPTKTHWRSASMLEWVETGLQKFVSTYEDQGITDISFPRLGCGNGGLDWEEVRPMMEHYLSDLSIPVFVHDFEVQVEIPEHLESVARQLSVSNLDSFTVESFAQSIRKLIEITGENLIEIQSAEPFQARMRDDNSLDITTNERSWHFESDDLRGVWLELMDGLLTEKKAGWSAKGAARPFLSMLSVLPHMRPVQIQHRNQMTPEIAIELNHLTLRSTAIQDQADMFQNTCH